MSWWRLYLGRFRRQGSLTRAAGFSGLFQLLNYVFPLLLLPLLASRLTAPGFGRLAVLQALFAYALTVTGFGFQLSAARQVATSRDKPCELGAVVTNTLIVKSALGCTAILAMWLMWAVTGQRLASSGEMLAGSSALVASMLFPVWLLQGLEWFGILAAAMTSIRAMTLFLIWAGVRDIHDVDVAMAAQYVPQIAASVVLFWILLARRQFKLEQPSRSGLAAAFRESFLGFSSNVAYWFYTSTNLLILAAISGSAAVAPFSAADRVIQAVRGFVYGGIQAALPSFARSEDATDSNWRRVMSTMRIVVPVFAGVSILIWLTSDFVIARLFGSGFERAAYLLRWMAPIPAIAAAGHCIVTLGLFGRGRAALWTTVIVSCAAVDLIVLGLSRFLFNMVADEAVTLAVIAAEVWMLGFGYFLFVRSKATRQ